MKIPQHSKFLSNIPVMRNETITNLRDLHYGKAYYSSDLWYAWKFRQGRQVTVNRGKPFTSEQALLQWGLENEYNRFFVHFAVTSRLTVASKGV